MDLLRISQIFNSTRDETLIWRVIQPLESLFWWVIHVLWPRIACIKRIYYEAKLSVTDVCDKNIIIGIKVVVILTKGVKVALATALISYSEITTLDN